MTPQPPRPTIGSRSRRARPAAARPRASRNRAAPVRPVPSPGRDDHTFRLSAPQAPHPEAPRTAARCRAARWLRGAPHLPCRSAPPLAIGARRGLSRPWSVSAGSMASRPGRERIADEVAFRGRPRRIPARPQRAAAKGPGGRRPLRPPRPVAVYDAATRACPAGLRDEVGTTARGRRLGRGAGRPLARPAGLGVRRDAAGYLLLRDGSLAAVIYFGSSPSATRLRPRHHLDVPLGDTAAPPSAPRCRPMPAPGPRARLGALEGAADPRAGGAPHPQRCAQRVLAAVLDEHHGYHSPDSRDTAGSFRRRHPYRVMPCGL